MTTATPDAPRPPLTTPPDSLVGALRESLPFLEAVISVDPSHGDPEAREHSEGSADFLRSLYPHLDDLTLASFCAYVATNLTKAVTEVGLHPDLIKVAIVFAENAKTLAWSLDTPEAPEQS